MDHVATACPKTCGKAVWPGTVVWQVLGINKLGWEQRCYNKGRAPGNVEKIVFHVLPPLANAETREKSAHGSRTFVSHRGPASALARIDPPLPARSGPL